MPKMNREFTMHDLDEARAEVERLRRGLEEARRIGNDNASSGIHAVTRMQAAESRLAELADALSDDNHAHLLSERTLRALAAAHALSAQPPASGTSYRDDGQEGER